MRMLMLILLCCFASFFESRTALFSVH